MSTAAAESRTVWFDSHCHLHDEADAPELYVHARASGVDRLVLIGTDPTSSARAAELAGTLGEGAYASVGLHPHEASTGTESLVAQLRELPLDDRPRPSGSVVAVGECGLDYFYEHSPRELQRQAFAQQIELAKSYDLALIVHTRDAWEDTLQILRSEGTPARTVIHCFSGGVDEARACLELGAFLSFSGIVTFKNAEAVRDAAQFCPLDALLVETDAPFLAPVPHRGERNEPAYVALVGEAIAALRSEQVDDVAAATRANTISAFDLSR